MIKEGREGAEDEREGKRMILSVVDEKRLKDDRRKWKRNGRKDEAGRKRMG